MKNKKRYEKFLKRVNQDDFDFESDHLDELEQEEIDGLNQRCSESSQDGFGLPDKKTCQKVVIEEVEQWIQED